MSVRVVSDVFLCARHTLAVRGATATAGTNQISNANTTPTCPDMLAVHPGVPTLHQAGTIKGGWFAIHRIFNILALVLAVAATAVIFSRFQWAGRADTAPYYTCELNGYLP